MFSSSQPLSASSGWRGPLHIALSSTLSWMKQATAFPSSFCVISVTSVRTQPWTPILVSYSDHVRTDPGILPALLTASLVSMATALYSPCPLQSYIELCL